MKIHYVASQMSNRKVDKHNGLQGDRKCIMNRETTPKADQETVSSANSFLISTSVSIFLSCVASNLSPLFAFSLSSSIAFSCLGRRQQTTHT